MLTCSTLNPPHQLVVGRADGLAGRYGSSKNFRRGKMELLQKLREKKTSTTRRRVEGTVNGYGGGGGGGGCEKQYLPTPKVV